MDYIVSLFRALSNELRLGLLRAGHDRPGITVTELAGTLGIPDFLASQHLRVLSDMRLIDLRPSGRSVHVHPPRQPRATRVSLAASVSRLLQSVWQAATKGNLTPDQVWDFGDDQADAAGDGVEVRLVFLFTAYTHLRRLLILRHLARNGPARREALAEEIGMSSQAAARQLSKLRRRGLLCQTGGRGGGWCLVDRPGTPLQAKLHAIVLDALATTGTR